MTEGSFDMTEGLSIQVNVYQIAFKGGAKLVFAVIYVTVYHVQSLPFEKAVFLFIKVMKALDALLGNYKVAGNDDGNRIQPHGMGHSAYTGAFAKGLCEF